ncbi:peptide deformylase [Candidatus Gracilibacteria bacterium]|nr:peptide deformylase [Candidatus Gracilibacteria bacterium]
MKKLQLEIGTGNKILRTISSEVKPHEFAQYKSFANAMLKYVKNPKNRAVGLAAPQVGVNKRIFVAALMDDYSDTDFRVLVMINPTVKIHGTSTLEDEEGCLSLPGAFGTVKRWQSLTVDFVDINQKKYSLDLVGLSARIIQHEFDHLNGLLYQDRMEENEEKIPLESITREDQIAFLAEKSGKCCGGKH